MKRLRVLLIGMLLLAPAPLLAQNGNQSKVDLRVLIDVSGSMQKNDPQNLRVPALRLLTGLLPEKSIAGIWLFAEKPQPLMPVKQVDARWKRRAAESAKQIHSRGKRTDIEQALQAAIADWRRPPAHDVHRHVVLLSDGMVDMSKQTARNEASRRRIIEQWLPKLQQLGISLHTVALSEHADHALLQKLSMASNGWYEKTKSADQLNRAFLRLFEQSAKQPSLPLTGNRFKVDDSIKDMTLLVFHGEDNDQINIITPNGQAYQMDSHPEKVEWHRENGFDLITVNDPVPGDWQLDAKADSDNRVLVVTNLELQVDDLPNYLIPGSLQAVHARLMQKGQPLTEQALIERTRFQLRQLVDGVVKEELLLDNGKEPDTKASDGVYSRFAAQPENKDVTELAIIAEGPTFEREYRHRMKLLGHLLSVEIEQLGEKDEYKFHIKLTQSPDLAGVTINRVQVQAAPDIEQPLDVPTAGELKWLIELHPSWAKKSIDLLVNAQIEGEKPFTVKQTEVLPKDNAKPAAELVEPSAKAKPESTGTDDHAQAPHAGANWKVVVAIVLLANGFLGLSGTVGFLYWKKRRKSVHAAAQVQQT